MAVVDGDHAGSTLRVQVLEIPAGGDVAEFLAGYSRRRRVCVCALSGSGAISSATIRRSASAVTFRGCFELLSLSATFLAGGANKGGSLSVSLAGPQGQVMGGAVAGPLVAAGTVVVVAVVFSDPAIHRLPEHDVEEEEADH